MPYGRGMSSLTIYKDRSWKRRLTVTDPNTGLPADLTGATIVFRVKPHTYSPDPPTIELTVGAGITLLTQSGATLGQADLDLSPSDTVAIEEALYVCDCKVTLNGQTFVHEVVVPTKIPIRDTL